MKPKAKDHELYKTWANMRYRCSNLSDKYYGAKGVRVCDRWQDFWSFVEDMSPRPSPKHSIHRKKSDGNYEPGNCEWITRRDHAILHGNQYRSRSPKTEIKIGMTPPHPGEFVNNEILAELKLSVSKAAQVLGVRRATLSDLVNGKAALSAEMALRLEKAFGLNVDTMLRMQVWYDVIAMRRCASEIDVKPYVAQ